MLCVFDKYFNIGLICYKRLLDATILLHYIEVILHSVFTYTKPEREKHLDKIGDIVSILKRENKKYIVPIVTIVSMTKSPFLVLISCLLSLRTKDKVTAEASNRLFKLADNPQMMLDLSTKNIEKAIYPVGFY